MRINYRIVVLLFPFLFLLAIPVFGSSDWVEYYTDDHENVSSCRIVTADREGGNYIVQVWVREVLSEKGREKYIQDRAAKKLSTEGYKNLSSIKSLSEIDCKKKQIMTLAVLSFDASGKKLDAYYVDQLKWVRISNNSSFNALRKEVCK